MEKTGAAGPSGVAPRPPPAPWVGTENGVLLQRAGCRSLPTSEIKLPCGPAPPRLRTVHKWSRPPAQRPREPPMWAAVKEETFFRQTVCKPRTHVLRRKQKVTASKKVPTLVPDWPAFMQIRNPNLHGLIWSCYDWPVNRQMRIQLQSSHWGPVSAHWWKLNAGRSVLRVYSEGRSPAPAARGCGGSCSPNRGRRLCEPGLRDSGSGFGPAGSAG